jgi:hypothetical protein
VSPWPTAGVALAFHDLLVAETLSEEHAALLGIVWEPIPWAGPAGESLDWPVWDYVRRRLYRTFPELRSAEDVLTTLPFTRLVSGSPGPRSRYGLIWHGGHVALSPGLDDRIGLTIAGLAVASRDQPGALRVADMLASIIGAVADADDSVEPKPFSAMKGELPLNDFVSTCGTPIPESSVRLPNRLIVETLNREYAPIEIRESGEPAILLGRSNMRPYIGVRTAEDYLQCIDVRETALEEPLRYESPLTLVQTLDYLSLALAADEQWPKGLRFTAAPDLQSAAALVAEVRSRVEYDNALSGLWNVIDQLQTPPVPADVVDVQFGGVAPRSLGRLQYWLEDRIHDEESVARVADALRVVRLAGRLRSEGQHSSRTARQQALNARRELGLPEAV